LENGGYRPRPNTHLRRGRRGFGEIWKRKRESRRYVYRGGAKDCPCVQLNQQSSPYQGRRGRRLRRKGNLKTLLSRRKVKGESVDGAPTGANLRNEKGTSHAGAGQSLKRPERTNAGLPRPQKMLKIIMKVPGGGGGESQDSLPVKRWYPWDCVPPENNQSRGAGRRGRWNCTEITPCPEGKMENLMTKKVWDFWDPPQIKLSKS